MDKDLSHVVFRINSSGWWTNLVVCDTSHCDEVKKACEVIAQAGTGHTQFKVVDLNGREIEAYGPDRHGRSGWHQPRRGRS